MMQTITFQLPESLRIPFEQACLESQRVRDAVLQELVARYLEDMEDVRDAKEALARGEATYSSHQVRQELGL